MTVESQFATEMKPSASSRWKKFTAWFSAFEEAVALSSSEIQDRRITALEQEVRRLALLIEQGAGEIRRS